MEQRVEASCQPLSGEIFAEGKLPFFSKPRSGDIFLAMLSPKDFIVNNRQYNRWVIGSNNCTTSQVLNVLMLRGVHILSG